VATRRWRKATFLTKFASTVTIVHRRDEFRASKIMQERVLSNPKIRVTWDTVVEEIVGDSAVTAVRLRNVATGATSEHPTDGVFVAIGHTPNTDLVKGSSSSRTAATSSSRSQPPRRASPACSRPATSPT
jgi:thioredoxin reductase